MADSPRGLLYGLAAYVMWGAFPLYWPLLEPAGAVEILGHRIIWSALLIVAVVAALGRVRSVLAVLAVRRQRLLLAVAACVISVNWATYIYGVNNGRVVESALGYFINPLVTVLMGVLILHEQLRRWQWIALGVAAVAVVVLAVDYGRPPWVALVLAFSFGTYGLAKKQAGVDAVESLTIETCFLAPVTLAYLLWLGATGDSTFTDHGVGHTLLLLSTGAITVVPLLCFGAAAIRVSMVSLGLLQYLAPILQFVLGLAWYHEAMPASRWIGFVLVWIALVVFTVEAYRHRRRQLRLVAEASAV